MAISQPQVFEAEVARDEACEAIAKILDQAFPVGDSGTFTSLIAAINQESASPERMLFNWDSP